MRAKMSAKSAPMRKHDPEQAPTKFGEQVTADHIIAQDVVDERVLGDRTALIMLDRATKWLDACPLLTKSALDTANALKDFLGPKDKIESFYSNNSPELKKVAHDNGWEHTTSTPGRPETNRVAERAVRSVVEGTRTALEHAGLPARWWCFACKQFCFAKNTAVIDGASAWEHRHNKGQFKGPQLPFGCLIDFKATPFLGKPGPKFDPKAIPGTFLCYHVLPGRRWQR